MLKELKAKLRQRLTSEYSNLFSRDNIDQANLHELIHNLLESTLRYEQLSLSDKEKQEVIRDLLDEFLGFGPIESLLKDPAVTEIMINGTKRIYVERSGHSQLTDVTFDNEQQLMYLIYKILAPTRRRVDESYPYTEVSLSDGSRANIVIPPLSLGGPTVTIRKFSQDIKTAEDLLRLGVLDKRMAEFLALSVKAKANIIFSGATGAGKTTTLNVFSSFIPVEERIITIEDTAELRLKQDHVVRLETRQPSIEGKGEVTIRELFKNSLRMRPDRVIIGEIRGSEALDMLQAICSGHRGAMAILHAESPEDVIYRIETMILTSGVPMSLAIIHRQIAAAINLIVQQEQMLDGARRITHITQVNGLKDDTVVLEDLFVYEIDSVDAQGKTKGRWKATGKVPCFMPLFKKAGLALPAGMFNS